jgi:uncharacterized protein
MESGEPNNSKAGQEEPRFRCPICSKPVTAPDPSIPKHLRFFPFCSERCRLVDLGAWLDADYRIPTKPDEQEDEPSPDGDPDEPTDR